MRAKRSVRPVYLLVLLLVLLLIGGVYLHAHLNRDPYKAKAYRLVAPYRFSIPRWEVKALSREAYKRLTTHPPPPDSSEAKTLVLDYLHVAQRIGALEGDIERRVAEASTSAARADVYAQIRPLQDEVEALRAQQERRQAVVERILASQVSTVLEDEDLGWLGKPLPPVVFEFTEPPYYLILSYRDHIELRLGIHLKPQLSLETREAIEEEAERELPNTSALVEGIGGFSTWPTMIIDRASLEWILSTIAHEWTHTYLIAYPLGRHYHDSPEMSAINETVADMVGQEVGREALRRFYPELAPSPTPTPEPTKAQSSPTPTPTPTFDFVREMRITRETVDKLLAEGKVEEAERYMEERRRFFVAHGYYIRKLNQAYFAFHGTYRTGPAAPSHDPIAPRLRKLREDSPSLAVFLQRVRTIRRVEDLYQLVPLPEG
ncbi:MAG: hypothetical protein GXO55_03465 [Chloroflexi bacterium]|nr:hypothetical protein [Chloroflexota bacterium]